MNFRVLNCAVALQQCKRVLEFNVHGILIAQRVPLFSSGYSKQRFILVYTVCKLLKLSKNCFSRFRENRHFVIWGPSESLIFVILNMVKYVQLTRR